MIASEFKGNDFNSACFEREIEEVHKQICSLNVDSFVFVLQVEFPANLFI